MSAAAKARSAYCPDWSVLGDRCWIIGWRRLYLQSKACLLSSSAGHIDGDADTPRDHSKRDAEPRKKRWRSEVSDSSFCTSNPGVADRRDIAAALIAADATGEIRHVIPNLYDDCSSHTSGRRGLIPTLQYPGSQWAEVRGPEIMGNPVTVARVHALTFGADLVHLLRSRIPHAAGLPTALEWPEIESLLLKGRDSQDAVEKARPNEQLQTPATRWSDVEAMFTFYETSPSDETLATAFTWVAVPSATHLTGVRIFDDVLTLRLHRIIAQHSQGVLASPCHYVPGAPRALFEEWRHSGLHFFLARIYPPSAIAANQKESVPSAVVVKSLRSWVQTIPRMQDSGSITSESIGHHHPPSSASLWESNQLVLGRVLTSGRRGEIPGDALSRPETTWIILHRYLWKPDVYIGSMTAEQIIRIHGSRLCAALKDFHREGPSSLLSGAPRAVTVEWSDGAAGLFLSS